MFKKKNHIGRPSNREIRMRKIKKIGIIVFPLIIFVVSIILVQTGSLKNIMGNSITNYYCIDNSWKLEGTTCSKTIIKETNRYADINLDNKIDNSDLELLNNYINNTKDNYTILSNAQLFLADLNGDGKIDENDMQSLQYIISNPNENDNTRVCETGYTLKDDHCELNEVIPAIENDNSVGANSKGTKVSLGFADFYKTTVGNTNVYAESVIKEDAIAAHIDMLNKLNNENNGYLASVSNVFLYSNKTFLNAVGDYGGISMPDYNSIVIRVYDDCCGNLSLVKEAVRHEVGHRIDDATNKVTGKPLFELEYNGHDMIYYTDKYEKAKLCNGNYCLRFAICNGNYSYKKSYWEFFADVFASFDAPQLTVNDELKTVRNEVKQKFQDIYNKNSNGFRRIQKEYMDFYVINYDANGGVGTMSPQLALQNKTTILAGNTFYNENLAFDGWKVERRDNNWLCYIDNNHKNLAWKNESYCKKYGYVLYENHASVTGLVSADNYITLHANWKRVDLNDVYTINYVAGDLNNKVGEQKAPYGETVLAPYTYSDKDNFKGWYAKRDDSYGYCYSDSSKTSSGWYNQKTCDLYGYVLLKDQQNFWNGDRNYKSFTLVAKYRDLFSVDFDANGGTGTMKNYKSVSLIDMFKIPKNTFKKNGYDFLGWYAKNDENNWYCYDDADHNKSSWKEKKQCVYGHYIFNDMAFLNIPSGDYSKVTLVAGWGKAYKLKFDGNGATSGSMETIILNSRNCNMTPNNKFYKEGYAFKGWYAKRADGLELCKKSSSNDTEIDWLDKATCNRTGHELIFQYLFYDFCNVKSDITFVAQWTKNFFVDFFANGGDGHMDTQEIPYGTPTSLKANAFKLKGYQFKGWHAQRNDLKWYCYTKDNPNKAEWAYEEDCKKKYLYKDKLKIKDTVERGEWVVMNAQWEKEEPFTVKYNANGGTGSMSNQKITYGVSTPMSANKFTKSGYEFKGWYANRDDGTWYCYTNPGQGSPAWVGKNTCESFGYFLYKDQLKLSNTAKPGKVVTMYAQWKTKQFTLRFDAAGGTGSMNDQKITYGTPTPITKNSFKKEGYNFNGWKAQRDDNKWYCYSSPSKTSTDWADRNVCDTNGYYIYKDELKVKDTANIGGYTTMHATWVENKYRVVYDANGGVGSMSDQRMTYGTPTAMNANKFTRSGYDFKGWYAQRDDNKWYCYTDLAKTKRDWVNKSTCGTYGYYLYKDKLKLSDTAKPGGAVTMYAQWAINYFTVKYNANGGAGSMSYQNITYGVSTAMNANKFTKTGYDFVGWHANYLDGTWYCYTDLAKTKRDWVNQSTCEKYGYYVYKDKLKISDTAPKGGIVTMYAQWQRKQFTLKFDANGGVGSMSDQKIIYGTPTPITKNSFKKEGYNFNGWKAQRDDNKWYCYSSPSKTSTGWADRSVCDTNGYYIYKDELKVKDTANIGGYTTMHATWVENKYRVVYDANGGTGTMSDQRMTYGVSTAMNANKFTRTGYDFKGWYARRDDNKWYCYTDSTQTKRDWVKKSVCGSYGYYLYKDQLKLSDTAKPGGQVTMYAQWAINYFTVKYDANGGVGSTSYQNITYGVSTPMNANKFTRTGYDFKGWHAQRLDGTWYCYTDLAKTKRDWVNQSTCGSYGYYLYKDKLKLSDTAPKGGIVTMYAQWKTNQFTVRYSANGGSGSMSDQKITYGVSTSLSKNKFYKPGYKFVGWQAIRSDGYHYCYTSSSKSASSWSSSSTCSGFGHCLYKDEQKVSKTAARGGLVTMYAQWKKV